MTVVKYHEYIFQENFDNKYIREMVCLQSFERSGKVFVALLQARKNLLKRNYRTFWLAKYFDFVGGSEFNGREKKAEVIDYVLTANMIDKDEAIMVRDQAPCDWAAK